MSAKVITIAQQKGGVGKTTLTIHLATTLMKMGYKVACFDIDPQASLSEWYKKRCEKFENARPDPKVFQVSGWRISGEIARFRDQFHFMLIDSPPHVETEARIAIRSADIVIVPVQPSPLDLWSTPTVLQYAEREGVPVKIVMNRVSPTKLTQTIANEIFEMNVPMSKVSIGSRVALALSVLHGVGIAEVMPSSTAAEEMRELCKETIADLTRMERARLSTAAA